MMSQGKFIEKKSYARFSKVNKSWKKMLYRSRNENAEYKSKNVFKNIDSLVSINAYQFVP